MFWMHLAALYNGDACTGQDVHLVSELKLEQISLTSFSNTWGDLAA